jgi:tRNA modification GTPase
MLVFDTICALSTAPYKSALAIVRLSGPKSLEILSHLTKRDVSKFIPNQSVFTRLYLDKDHPTEMIDEAVVTYYQGPKSYTGFDSVDFSLHGSMIIVEELMDALVKYGARRADKGEFSAQAFFNGKMDLLKAEGINDLINASSKRAKVIATQTLSGKNTTLMQDLKNQFLEDLSQMEYYVENSYEDADSYDVELDQIGLLLDHNILDLNKIIENTKKANKEYQGFNIAIAGEPNVGKSTLLNALVGEDKAIVSPIPGTTRDVVEGEKEINGLLFRFKDTAGLRKTDDIVENLGIERSYKTIQAADLVILSSDCGFEDIDKNEELMRLLKDKPVIRLATKKDINTNLEGADIAICSTKEDLTPLINLLLDKLNLNTKEESSFLGKREEEYLIRIRDQVIKTREAISATHQIDIVSDNLRVAIAFINELMGNNESQTMEDIYQTLFSKFCLGK